MLVINYLRHWPILGALLPPPGRWRFSGFDWMPGTWASPPVLGWQILTPEDCARYPLVAPLILRLGPLDLDFRPCL